MKLAFQEKWKRTLDNNDQDEQWENTALLLPR